MSMMMSSVQVLPTPQPLGQTAAAHAPPAVADFDYDLVQATIADLRHTEIFFIGGSPKSGTTWLQLLMDAHPEINCTGEGHFADQLAPQLRQATEAYNQVINEKNAMVFDRFGGFPLLSNDHLLYLLTSAIALLLVQNRRARPGRMLGEKTPDNVSFFPLLQRIFPQARFIHIIRDGRDCATSGWFHNLRNDPAGARQAFGSFDQYAEGFAEYWSHVVQDGLRFAAVNPGRTAMVRYEDLCAAPAATLASLFGFLGVAAEPAVVEQCCQSAAFARLSGGRAPGQEDPGSFFRRGLPGDWRNHFSAQAAKLFAERGGPVLARLGYG